MNSQVESLNTNIDHKSRGQSSSSNSDHKAEQYTNYAYSLNFGISTDKEIEHVPDQSNENQIKTQQSQQLCSICCIAQQHTDMHKIAACEHNFCKSCLITYAEASIKNFQSLSCPAGCGAALCKQEHLLKLLGQHLMELYKKIQFIKYTNKQNITRCSNQKCYYGILQANEVLNKHTVQCNVCFIKFCKKCLWPTHEGSCKSANELFMGNYLLLATCPQCHNKIERNQGCNHMTCLCKHQFCYLCLQKWKSDHTCPLNCERVQKIQVLKRLQDNQNKVDPMLIVAIEQQIQIDNIVEPKLKQAITKAKQYLDEAKKQQQIRIRKIEMQRIIQRQAQIQRQRQVERAKIQQLHRFYQNEKIRKFQEQFDKKYKNSFKLIDELENKTEQRLKRYEIALEQRSSNIFRVHKVKNANTQQKIIKMLNQKRRRQSQLLKSILKREDTIENFNAKELQQIF